MEPIVPMEPVSSTTIPVGPDWLTQVKWDGVRLLVYADAGEVRLFNRRRRERTHHYPELLDLHAYCKVSDVVLDGEVIALGADGKPDFHAVMRRDGLRRLERVDAVRVRVPVIYMVFDILFMNGQWLTDRPLCERLQILAECVQPGPCVQVVPSFTDGQAVFRAVCEQGMEGIVAKRIDSTYHTGSKHESWLKVKNYQDVIAVIGGYTVNDAGRVNAVLLGLYDDAGRLRYIGHTGAGKVTASEWRRLTVALEALVIPQRPFVNRPEREGGVRWVRPVRTVKVRYMEWVEGRSLRQPTIEAFVDVPPDECRWRPGLTRQL